MNLFDRDVLDLAREWSLC